jgi:hypothetical protein
MTHAARRASRRLRHGDKTKENTMKTTTTGTPGTFAQRLVRLTALGLLALCVLAAAAAARPTPLTVPGDPLDPRTTDPAARLFLTAHATGVQKYACQPDGTWLFTDPVATLSRTNGTAKPIVMHFLNFATGRPVWPFKDGSSVEAARFSSASGGAGNIALLLLESVANTVGPDGDRFAPTAWVQRLNTSGGVAPAGSCTPGDRAAVPYTADYSFWR